MVTLQTCAAKKYRFILWGDERHRQIIIWVIIILTIIIFVQTKLTYYNIGFPNFDFQIIGYHNIGCPNITYNKISYFHMAIIILAIII